MSGVAHEGIRTSRLEPTYGGNVFPSEVLPSMNPPGRVEKGFLPRFTPVTVDNNARDQEGMTRTVMETYHAYLDERVAFLAFRFTFLLLRLLIDSTLTIYWNYLAEPR